MSGDVKVQAAPHPGIKPTDYVSVGAGPDQLVDGAVPEEAVACISLNGSEIATFMCTPHQLDAMALGFLFNEGIIDRLDEVRSLHVSAAACVDVWLHDTSIAPPERLIVTAGCGGGVTFDDLTAERAPVVSSLRVTPARLAHLMRAMHLGATGYQEARGIHTAALADTERILLQVEDIGRHNCLDKLAGAALQAGISTRDHLLFSSGRISSEMLNKARRLQVPVVCSRTSPTSLSLALADAWHITVVAYLRQERMRVYTHRERVLAGDPVLSNPTEES